MASKKDKFGTERELFLEHIKAAGLRRTEQRDLILDTFLSTEEHLTSEDLYGLIHKIDPDVGLTTVYRTLKLLTDAGLAREVRFGDGKTYYEHHYNHEHHDHMICTECGKLVDIEMEVPADILKKAARQSKFKPETLEFTLRGKCPDCVGKT